VIRSLVFALISVLVWPALASADVIHLTNGRTMEGQVLKTEKGVIHLKVPGGRLAIPASTVKRVEQRRTPQEEYATRARRVNTSNPRELRRLAHWASSRGLGEQALQLRAQAKGLELDARVNAVRSAVRADPFLDLYHWARDQRHSVEVQRWLLKEALKRNPKHIASRVALQALDAAQERLARRRAQPNVAPPEPEDKIVSLEAKLNEQKSEAAKLRARLAALEEEARQRECDATRLAENLRRRRRVRRRTRGRRTAPPPSEVPTTVVARPPPSTLYGKPVRLKWE
jgi:hypothetical protein